MEEFPFPWYLPGKWKSRVKETKKMRKALWTKARSIADQRQARGDKRDCLLDTKLDEYAENGWPFPEWVINYLFGEMFEGGTDTTANHLLTLILAFASHPYAQKRARKR